MKNVLEKIKTRGYWTTRVFPSEFRSDRIQTFAEIQKAVRISTVYIRGWDFPHLDETSSIERHNGYIGQSIDWQHYVELWRAYKSGQFVSVSSLYGDWRDQSTLWPPSGEWQPKAFLGVEDTVFRFIEVFEFASRWASAVPSSGQMIVECALVGLTNRRLGFSSRRLPRDFYNCHENEWTWRETYSTADLFSKPRENAILPTARLLELFGWDVSDEGIRRMQGELRA